MSLMQTETPLRAHVVRSAVRVILEQAKAGTLDINDLGVSSQQVRDCAQEGSFLAKQRQIVTTTIDAVAKGTLHVVGLPVFDLSAEYYAAVLKILIKPQNWLVACAWMGKLPGNTDLIDGTAAEGIAPEKLFALLCELHSDESCRDDCLNARMALALTEAEELES